MKTVKILFTSLFVLCLSQVSFANTLVIAPATAGLPLLMATVSQPGHKPVVITEPWFVEANGVSTTVLPILGKMFYVTKDGDTGVLVSVKNGKTGRTQISKVPLQGGVDGTFLVFSFDKSGGVPTKAKALVRLTLMTAPAPAVNTDSVNIDWSRIMSPSGTKAAN